MAPLWFGRKGSLGWDKRTANLPGFEIHFPGFELQEGYHLVDALQGLVETLYIGLYSRSVSSALYVGPLRRALYRELYI